ncbi:hypothetical protein [Lysobacter sp. HA35]
MGKISASGHKKRSLAARPLLPIALLLAAAYLALPFLLIPVLVQCHPSRMLNRIMPIAYPFTRMASNNAYKRYWLEVLNRRYQEAAPGCPDRDSQIYAP